MVLYKKKFLVALQRYIMARGFDREKKQKQSGIRMTMLCLFLLLAVFVQSY